MKKLSLKNLKDHILKFGGLTEDEQQICELLTAAYANEIISEASSINDDGYYTFKLSNKKSYDVCFGKNPDRRKYPNAERAIRASDFVSDLLQIIDTSYNCFVVPAVNITEPSVEKIGKRIFGEHCGAHKISLSEDYKTGSYTSNYELDVMISVMVGKKIKRIVDTLAVELSHESDGTKNISYKHIKNHERSASNIDNKEEILGKINTDDLTYLLDHITGDQGAADSDENKIKILDALAASHESEFYSFLTKDCVNNSVGQVTVRPCSIFVDAVPEKTFTYQISRKADENQKFALEFRWNKPKEAFDNTPLYLVVEGEDFKGLTYDQNEGDSKGNTTPRKEFDTKKDRIVVGCKIEGGKTVSEKLTLLHTPENALDSFRELPYKGVKNYAVELSGISDELVNSGIDGNAFYLINETELLNGKRYLSADIGICAHDAHKAWNGDLVESAYINKDGKMCFGKVHKDLPVYKCDFCSTEFRTNSNRYKKYQEKHKIYKSVLPDVEHYCDYCADGRAVRKEIAGESAEYRLYANVFGADQKNNDLFVVDKADVTATEIIRKCYNCDNYVINEWYGKYGECKLCGNFICNDCINEKGNYEEKLGYLLCSECHENVANNPEYHSLAGKILSYENQISNRKSVLQLERSDFTDKVYSSIKDYMKFMTLSDRTYIYKTLSDYRKQNYIIESYKSALKDKINVSLLKYANSLNAKKRKDEFAYVRIDVIRVRKNKANKNQPLGKIKSYYFSSKNGKITFGKEDD